MDDLVSLLWLPCGPLVAAWAPGVVSAGPQARPGWAGWGCSEEFQVGYGGEALTEEPLMVTVFSAQPQKCKAI